MWIFSSQPLKSPIRLTANELVRYGVNEIFKKFPLQS